jgi:hypothetical protein
MKTLDGMTLDELRELESERFWQYEDRYNAAGYDAALRVGYVEVATEIRKRLRRVPVECAAAGGMDRPEQTNGVNCTPISRGVAVHSPA